MIQVKSKVLIPRSNGTQTIATVKAILPGYDSMAGQAPAMACVGWMELMWERCIWDSSMDALPRVRKVEMACEKWLPLAQLKSAE